MTATERKVVGSGSMQLQIRTMFLYVFLVLLLLILTNILSSILEIAPIYCQEETVNNTSAAIDQTIKQEHNNMLLNYWVGGITVCAGAAVKVKATALFLAMAAGTTGSLLGVNYVISPTPSRVLTSLQKLRKDPLTQMKIVVVFHILFLPLLKKRMIDWLISHLPDFIGNIFSNRVPVSSIENLDAISVLQFQYNIIVVLMAFSLVLIFAAYLFTIGFKGILKNRDTIISNFTVLSKILPSIKALEIMLIFLKW
jgi:hypothetical protein